MGIEGAHRKAVAQETVVSMVFNAIVIPAILWFLHVPPPVTLLDEQPIVKDMLLGAGFATLMMTLVVTNIVRMRIRKGAVPHLDWPRQERGILRYVPQNLLLRAIFFAFSAIVLLIPPGLVVVALIGILPLTKLGFLGFNIAFGAVVGLVMTRFVVLAALADPLPPKLAKT